MQSGPKQACGACWCGMISSPHVVLRRPVLQKCTALRSELTGTVFFWSQRVGGIGPHAFPSDGRDGRLLLVPPQLLPSVQKLQDFR